MKSRLFLMFLFGFSTSLSCSYTMEPKKSGQQFKTAANIELVKKIISKKIKNTTGDICVVLDVDNVLLKAQCLVSERNRALDEAAKCLHDILKIPYKPMSDAIAKYISQQYLNKKPDLMDHRIPSYIAKLQKYNRIETICLTSSAIGRFGDIKSYEDFRLKEELGRHGLNFKKDNLLGGYHLFYIYKNRAYYLQPSVTKSLRDIYLEEKGLQQKFKTFDKFKRKTFILKDGVIFTNYIDIRERIGKGPIFTIVLDFLEYKPSHVIFIDDRRHNLESMSKALITKQIPHTLIHYTECEFNKKKLGAEWGGKYGGQKGFYEKMLLPVASDVLSPFIKNPCFIKKPTPQPTLLSHTFCEQSPKVSQHS